VFAHGGLDNGVGLGFQPAHRSKIFPALAGKAILRRRGTGVLFSVDY
jgi:hypothetical protein